MSYAGVEREYSRRCRPEDHQWSFNRHCHTCGVSKDGLIKEAELILKLDKEGKLGRDCS